MGRVKHVNARLLFIVAAMLLLGCVHLQQAFADNIALYYSANYSLVELGAVPGVPGPYGGLTLKASDLSKLLIGGRANNSDAAIYEIGVTRDADNHITGFVGDASFFSTAPNIDGGLAYGPGGILFYTGYPINAIGQIKPGSTAPNKIITATGVTSSVGSLNFVPSGQPGAGGFKIVSYNGGGFYDAELIPDGSGTYDISSVSLKATASGGPEGFVYVPPGSDDFSNPSLLLAQYGAGKVVAYELDSDGNPIVSTANDFVQGLTGAEGGFVDPLTGDFLFSTFGGGNKVVEVRGFEPIATPEPSFLQLLGAGLCSIALALRRKRP